MEYHKLSNWMSFLTPSDECSFTVKKDSIACRFHEKHVYLISCLYNFFVFDNLPELEFEYCE